jgi:hypothetical protein
MAGYIRYHEAASGRACACAITLTSAEDKQCAADQDRAHAYPHREVDGLPFVDRQLDRSYLDLMGRLGVAETAICQTQDACNDGQDRCTLDRVNAIASLYTLRP